MIRKAEPGDEKSLANLAAKLWEHSPEELAKEFEVLLQDPKCALFLLYTEDTPIGFAQCQLRQDYVEGTSSSPVGYLEGVYVEPWVRRKGNARRLISACEAWAKAQGCREFASDCELSNRESLAFHLASGFTEANRIICFVKPL